MPPLTILTILTIIIIIITMPKPAYGRQGLAGVSLRASGAQLRRGKCSFFVTHTQTLHHNVYIIKEEDELEFSVCLPSPSSPSSSSSRRRTSWSSQCACPHRPSSRALSSPTTAQSLSSSSWDLRFQFVVTIIIIIIIVAFSIIGFSLYSGSFLIDSPGCN